MVRIFAGVMTAVVLAGCATTPQTPEQQIAGNWTCKTESDGVVVDGQVKYNADGTAFSSISMTMDGGDATISMTADAESTWSADENTMSEIITKATAKSGSMGDTQVPLAMFQEILDGMLGEAAISNYEVAANTLKLVEVETGVTTNCTR